MGKIGKASEGAEVDGSAATAPQALRSEERRLRIVRLARERGLVGVDWLADHFRVTPQTIRRDIEALADGGAVRRYRGGVAPVSSVENISYAERRIQNAAAKHAIAQAVAAAVPEGSSLFITIGTTMEAVAQALCPIPGLRVVTNSLNVARILHEGGSARIAMAGGDVRPGDGGIVGASTVDFINRYKADIGIMGISGIDEEGDLLDYDSREVRVSQAILANSRRVFLAMDVSKFGRNAFARVGHLRDVDRLFLDQPPAPIWAQVIAESGCALALPEQTQQATKAV